MVQPYQWVIFAIFAVFAVLLASQVPKFWRNEMRPLDKPQPWWPFGEVLWRAYVRGGPIGVVATCLGVLLVLAGGLGQELSSAYLDATFRYVLFPIWALSGLVAGGVVLLNWPKFAVAPHLRDQPGAVQEWYEGWRQRKAAGKRGPSSAFWETVVAVVIGLAAVFLAIRLGIID